MVEVVDISKNEIRKLVKEQRLKVKNKKEKEALILKNILANEKVQTSSNILVYVSLDLEVDTYNLINKLLELGKNVYVPKVVAQDLKFYKINSFQELKKGKFNILEPISNTLYENTKSSCIIVPGLLFDENNNRLGYGGGYYDRFLSQEDIYKIGICFSEFKVSNLEVLEHDIKMDEVITERNLWNLKD